MGGSDEPHDPKISSSHKDAHPGLQSDVGEGGEGEGGGGVGGRREEGEEEEGGLVRETVRGCLARGPVLNVKNVSKGRKRKES